MGDTRSSLGAVRSVSTAWVIIVLAMLLAGWLLTHPWEARIDPWDKDVERWLAAHRTRNLNRVAAACTFLGDTLVGVALAAVVAAAVSLWQRSIRPAIFLAVLLAGALGLYLSGVHLIPRDRPPVPILDLGLVPDHSFPSGHVATAVVVYGGTALLIAWASPRSWRWVRLLLLVPIAVALARMYQGAHHPTDVLTSLVCVTAWVAAVTHVLLPVTSSGGRPGPSRAWTGPATGR